MPTIFNRNKCAFLCLDSEAVPFDKMRRAHIQNTAKLVDCRCFDDSRNAFALADFPKNGAQLKSVEKHDNPNVLLLCGCYFEHEITACALQALSIGFDVQLLLDQVMLRNDVYFGISQQRLIQIGAVPTTLDQVLFLWQSVESNFEMRDRIRQALQWTQIFDSGAPR